MSFSTRLVSYSQRAVGKISHRRTKGRQGYCRGPVEKRWNFFAAVAALSPEWTFRVRVERSSARKSVLFISGSHNMRLLLRFGNHLVEV